MSSEESIQFNRHGSIDLPTKESERRRAISRIDWERCKRNIGRCKPPSQIYSIVYSMFFGIFVSTGLSYVTVENSTEISPFVKALFLSVTGFSLLLSVLFFALEYRMKADYKVDIDMILLDMKEIESTFPKTIEEQNEQEPSSDISPTET